MNRVIVITGASSGIGYELSQICLQKGDVVYGLSRNKPENLNYNYIHCDITNRKMVDEAVAQIVREQGRIDILFNNAGMGISGAIETSDINQIKKQFEINFFGVINVIQSVLPYMRKQLFGKIITTSSLASKVGIPFQGFYSATKASLDSIAFSLRQEVKDYNIKVCNVLPGDTKTNFTSKREKELENNANEYSDKMKKAVAKMERDEQNGMSAYKVAKIIYRASLRKSPPLYIIAGGINKTLGLLIKLFPSSLANYVVRKMYIGK